MTSPLRCLLTLALAALPLPGQPGERDAAELRAASQHLQQGKADQAIDECKRVLARDARFAAAHMLLGQAYLAKGSIAMIAEAKAELRQALDLDPGLLWARFYLARIYLDQGADEKAREQLELGLRQRPDVPHFLSLLGEARRKLGDPAASAELNRKALKLAPALSPAHYYLALACLDLKQQDTAIAELEAAVHSPYVTPEILSTLAALYIKTGKLADAEALCRQAIALDPSRPEPHLNLARVFNARHASDRALEALQKVLPQGREFPASEFYQNLQADIWVEQGIACQDKGLTARAIEAFTRALDIDPAREDIARRLADLRRRPPR